MKLEHAHRIRAAGWAAFLLYLAALVYFMFFAERYGRTFEGRDYHYNLVLFKEIRRFLAYRKILGAPAVAANLLGNIIGFIPFGFFLPIISKKHRKCAVILLFSLEFSLFIECTQLLFKVGCFDVDDLLMNTMGGVIGWMLFYFCNRIRRRRFG